MNFLAVSVESASNTALPDVAMTISTALPVAFSTSSALVNPAFLTLQRRF
jgi:hypothetical protein